MNMKKYKKKKFQHSDHVRLWNMIIHILQNDDLETIALVSALKEKAFKEEFSKKKKRPLFCCFACDFVGDMNCKYCPLKWPRCSNQARTCSSRTHDGLYSQLLTAFRNYKNGLIALDDVIEIAKQIRDVPIKKWVKCK